MAPSQSQRLRHMAQKASRRKAVVGEKLRAKSATTSGRGALHILAGARAPVRTCVVSEKLFADGIGWVVLARTLPSGQVGASFFLGERLVSRREGRVFRGRAAADVRATDGRDEPQTTARRHRSVRRPQTAARTPTQVLSALRRARASPRPRRCSATFLRRRRHLRSARTANPSSCPARTTRAHAYELSSTRSRNAAVQTGSTTSSMWAILTDGHAPFSSRDGRHRACVAGSAKERRSSSRPASKLEGSRRRLMHALGVEKCAVLLVFLLDVLQQPILEEFQQLDRDVLPPPLAALARNSCTCFFSSSCWCLWSARPG